MRSESANGSLWRFFLLLLCLLTAAVNTGNNLLYLVFSIMLAAAAISLAVSGIGLKRLEAELRIPDEAVAGRSFLMGVEAAARPGRLPAPWAEAVLRGLPPGAPPVKIPALAPGERTLVCATSTIRKRGVHAGLRVDLISRYPFGLFKRRRRLGSGGALVVTPRRFPIRSLEIPPPSGTGSAALPHAGEGSELFNIRDYTTQDDARRIDWKASARLDRPMLKEFEREHERILEIVVDERPAGGATPAEFERLVETAASILDHGAEKGIQTRLLVARAGGRCEVLAGRAAMRYLASVGTNEDAAPPEILPAGGAGVPRVVLSLHAASGTPIRVTWASEEEHP